MNPYGSQSKSFQRLNPHLFHVAESAGLGAVEPQKHAQPPGALVKAPRARRAGKPSVVVVVSIVSFRQRELDSDNLVAGCKPLRDAIAQSLGIDDADPRVRWEYGQIETRGNEGTVVRISAA